MGIAFLVGLLLVVLIVAAFIIAGKCFYNGNSGAGGASVAIAIALIATFLIVPFSIRTVQTGEYAAVKVLGEAKEVRTPGTHFDFWITKTYDRYDAKVQSLDIETAAYSADAQTMSINMIVQYQIASDKILDIERQYGSLATLESRIQSIAIEKAKSVLSADKAMDIIANRAEMSPAVETAIKNAVGEEYFVNIVAVVLTNIDFSDAFELAVEEKMIAEQAKLKADYENQMQVAKAEAEAQAKIKEAEAKAAIAQAEAEARLKEAEAEIEIAKAKAEALEIAAKAEANANSIIAESLTPELLDKILAEAWDGKLPTIVGNGDYILPSDILGSNK